TAGWTASPPTFSFLEKLRSPRADWLRVQACLHSEHPNPRVPATRLRPPASTRGEPMNNPASRRSNVLVMHPDPLLSAGLVAALRQQPQLEIFVDGVDSAVPDGPAIDVVIADYAHAMRLADPAARAAACRSLEAARILALTANDREA